MKKILLLLLVLPLSLMAQNNGNLIKMGVSVVNAPAGFDLSKIEAVTHLKYDFYRLENKNITIEITYQGSTTTLQLLSSDQMYANKRYVNPIENKKGNEWRIDNNVSENTVIKLSIDNENNITDNTL
jgi:hypothetical protein